MDRKRILVFGDSNSWGFVPNPTGDPTTRYDASTRWPRAMIRRLGAGFELIEEGLSARTTNLDDPQLRKLGEAVAEKVLLILGNS
ncbi:MAG TPA: hypothetical protein VJX28_03215 [Chthoniobacterales bacterium]|nr:hypothetical protein [Chthoniobacterales bacterium]